MSEICCDGELVYALIENRRGRFLDRLRDELGIGEAIKFSKKSNRWLGGDRRGRRVRRSVLPAIRSYLDASELEAIRDLYLPDDVEGNERRRRSIELVESVDRD